MTIKKIRYSPDTKHSRFVSFRLKKDTSSKVYRRLNQVNASDYPLSTYIENLIRNDICLKPEREVSISTTAKFSVSRYTSSTQNGRNVGFRFSINTPSEVYNKLNSIYNSKSSNGYNVGAYLTHLIERDMKGVTSESSKYNPNHNMGK